MHNISLPIRILCFGLICGQFTELGYLEEYSKIVMKVLAKM